MANKWITNALKRVRIKNATERLLLVILANMANDDGFAWPSTATLAEELCVEERAVPRIARRLETKGLVKVAHRRRPNGSYQSNGYQMIMASYPVRQGTPCLVGQGDPVSSVGESLSGGSSLETKTDTKTDTTYKVVVVQATATESTAIALNAEQPQPKPADTLREGTDTEQALIEAGHKNDSNNTSLSKVPPKVLSQTAEALIVSLATLRVSRKLAEKLIVDYGETRVLAVWHHMQSAKNPLGVGFLRSELANPFYVPLDAAAPASAPAQEADVLDEGEIDTQADTPVIDASVKTFVKDKTTAADVWRTAADQLVLKEFREMKGAPLVAYDASTHTYTVCVASASILRATQRYHKIIHSTLTGLHASASVTFIVRDSIQKGNLHV